MSRKSHLSKEEISKQFDLPERKSKIATLMKQDEVAYCICRSSDSSSFMIGCDSCEEWYHGDCIGISEKASKDIKRYYCERCRFEDPTLITRYKTARPESEKKRVSSVPSLPRCEKCSNCTRREDCGRCPGCKAGSRCLHRVCLQTRTRQREISPEWEPPPKWKRSPSPEEPRSKKFKDRRDRKRGRSKRKEDVKKESRQHKSKKRKESLEEEVEEDKYPPQQCYGPGCVKQTRRGSKYCSDDCGLKMAHHRIYQVLPQRIQEWSLTPCVAEDRNKTSLDEVRAQLKDVRAKLKELDDRHIELDKLVERGKEAKVEEADENDEDDGTTETTMYCITCGLEIHSKTAIRHMDKCYKKNEAQTSFGSIYKTRIQGNNMFCDFFNPTNATYCKRLRVLCPEHSKEPKANPTDVCGCPLVSNVFELNGSFCKASKLNCKKHYSWEKIWRAEIDMERVRQWLKVDELVEKEREIRNDLANRGGVLALMLHSTYNHEVMDQLTGATTS